MTVHNVLILSFHCYNMKPTLKSHRIHILSFVVLLCFIAYDATVAMTNYYSFPRRQFPCRWQIFMSVSAYVFCKISILYLYLERLFIVFKGSDLKFSNTFTWISRSIIFIVFISYPIMLYIIRRDLGRIDRETGECFADFPDWLNYLTFLIDSSFSVVILILFSRRLLRLSMRVQSSFSDYNPSSAQSSSPVSGSRNRFDTSDVHPPNFAPNNSVSHSNRHDDNIELNDINSDSQSNNLKISKRSLFKKISIGRKHTHQSVFGNDKRLLSVVKKTSILTMVAIFH